jgi:plasmid stabilization system protein ParE
LHDDSLRELIFQNYRILYLVVEDVVAILVVVHGASDLYTRLRERGYNV